MFWRGAREGRGVGTAENMPPIPSRMGHIPGSKMGVAWMPIRWYHSGTHFHLPTRSGSGHYGCLAPCPDRRHAKGHRDTRSNADPWNVSFMTPPMGTAGVWRDGSVTSGYSEQSKRPIHTHKGGHGSLRSAARWIGAKRPVLDNQLNQTVHCCKRL